MEVVNPSRRSYHLSTEVVNDGVFAIESYSLQKEREVIPLEGTSVPLPASSILYLNVTFQPQECGSYLNDGVIVLKSEKVCYDWLENVCATSKHELIGGFISLRFYTYFT